MLFRSGMPQYLEDGTELWDDALSNEELDFICGVYKARTGEFCASVPCTLSLTATISQHKPDPGPVMVAQNLCLEGLRSGRRILVRRL